MYVQEFILLIRDGSQLTAESDQVLSMWVRACQVDPEELHGRPDHLLCGLPEL